MGRRKRYRRGESLPLAFVIGLLWGIIGILRTVPLFGTPLAPLQGSLQLLEEATIFATFTAFLSFALRSVRYIKRGNIYKTTVYTIQCILTYVFNSILDGLFSFFGYYIGVVVGLEIRKFLLPFMGTG